MENTRRRDGSSERNASTRNDDRKNAASPHGFDGMNFEQQRGSYKNSDRGGTGNEGDRKDLDQKKGQP